MYTERCLSLSCIVIVLYLYLKCTTVCTGHWQEKYICLSVSSGPALVFTNTQVSLSISVSCLCFHKDTGVIRGWQGSQTQLKMFSKLHLFDGNLKAHKSRAHKTSSEVWQAAAEKCFYQRRCHEHLINSGSLRCALINYLNINRLWKMSRHSPKGQGATKCLGLYRASFWTHPGVFSPSEVSQGLKEQQGGGSNNLWQIIGFIRQATGKWPGSKGPKQSWAKHFNRQYNPDRTFLQSTINRVGI